MEYARALFSLSRDEALDDRILKELEVVLHVSEENPTFLRILSAPNLSKEERCGILDNVFRDKVHPYVLNTLKLLTERGSARVLPDMCRGYTQLYQDAHGILPVKAVTAVPLTAQQETRLKAKLEEMTGKTVLLTNILDASCLGGMRLDFDGKRIDDTVSHRLDVLRSLLLDSTV